MRRGQIFAMPADIRVGESISDYKSRKDAEHIHSCSYYCERPECIKAQRDELRDKLEALQGVKP